MIQKVPGDAEERRKSAQAALDEVQPGMKLGLGTGRTAEAFVRLLGEKVRAGLDVIGVPTSEATQLLAGGEGIRLTTLEDDPELDLTIDGADEIGPGLRLIKGGGGALLREKIVAAASKRMVVVADSAKVVATLGKFPLPIEVIPFGMGATRVAIQRVADELGLAGELVLRQRNGTPFVTDSGNRIIDASFGRIPDPDTLAARLSGIPGVVEHGLFIGLASAAIVARGSDVELLKP
jgi:ribose 5-phosphate isomerase A